MTTPAPLDDERMREIEARMAAATPGPWTMRVRPYGHEFIAIATPSPMNKPIVYVRFDDAPVDEQDETNAAFIAHAPADIAALLAEVRNMRGAIATYVDNCDKDHLDECQFCREYGHDACPREPREDFLALRRFT